MTTIKIRLEEDVEKIKKGELGFFILPEFKEDVQKEIILKHMANKYKNGIYVSFKSDNDEVSSYINKLGIKDDLYTIAKKGTKKLGDNMSIFREDSPFVDVSSLIEQLTQTGEYNFIVLDSISYLLLRYDSRIVAKFLNHLVESINIVHVVGIGTDSDSTNLLVQRIADNSKIFTGFDSSKGRLFEERVAQKSLLEKQEENDPSSLELKPNINNYNASFEMVPGESSFIPRFNTFITPLFALVSLILSAALYSPKLDIKLSPGENIAISYIPSSISAILILVSIILFVLYFKSKKSNKKQN